MDENWLRYELLNRRQIYETKLAENCCLVRTQHNFCTQQVRYVGITMIVTLFGLNLFAGSRENSFQEVLKAVLFGVGVYLQQLTIGSFVGAQLG